MQIQQSAIPGKEQSAAYQQKDIKPGIPGKVAANVAAANKAAEAPAAKGTEEQTMYLKVLSRLENMIQKDELPEKALDGFMKAVKARLEEASAQDKKMVLSTPEAKALEIMKVEEFAEKIEDGLEDADTAPKVFALLKQSKFVEMMNGKENQPSAVYGPDGKAAASPKNAPGSPGAISDPQQAIAALKSMQAGSKGAMAAANLPPPLTSV